MGRTQVKIFQSITWEDSAVLMPYNCYTDKGSNYIRYLAPSIKMFEGKKMKIQYDYK